MNDFLNPKIFEDETLSNEEYLKRGVSDRIPDNFMATDNTNKVEVFAVNYLNELFQKMRDNNVSDIHLESLEVGNICRVRKDGILHKYGRLLADTEFTYIRKKIFARAMIDESYAKSNAVDARAWLRFGTNLDLRISSIRTVAGYTIVIRLLDQSNSGRKLETIEMSDAVREATLDVIQSAHGLILITGPTGSGKTATLYAALDYVNKINVNIITYEDPVENKMM